MPMRAIHLPVSLKRSPAWEIYQDGGFTFQVLIFWQRFQFLYSKRMHGTLTHYLTYSHLALSLRAMVCVEPLKHDQYVSETVHKVMEFSGGSTILRVLGAGCGYKMLSTKRVGFSGVY